jgi:hypothetical protein
MSVAKAYNAKYGVNVAQFDDLFNHVDSATIIATRISYLSRNKPTKKDALDAGRSGILCGGMPQLPRPDRASYALDTIAQGCNKC